jgi:hypothetical protein
MGWMRSASGRRFANGVGSAEQFSEAETAPAVADDGASKKAAAVLFRKSRRDDFAKVRKFSFGMAKKRFYA